MLADPSRRPVKGPSGCGECQLSNGHRSLHTTSVYLQHIAPTAAVAEAAAKTAHLAVQP